MISDVLLALFLIGLMWGIWGLLGVAIDGYMMRVESRTDRAETGKEGEK